jgi:hypothetical protein
MKKLTSLLGAIGSGNGNVATTVLLSLLFRAGNALNDAVSREIRGVVIAPMDMALQDMLGFDGEQLAKPATISDASTLYNATLVALVEWVRYTEADAKGRQHRPFAWLAEPSKTTGKQKLRTIPELFDDIAEYRASQSFEHIKQQLETLSWVGAIKKAESANILEARKVAELQKQKDEAKDKLAYVADWKAELKALSLLTKDDLYETIDRAAKACNISDSLVKEAAASSIDMSVQRLMKGEYVNIDPEVAAMAR